MKTSNNKELIIQISILIICTFTIALQIKSPTKAQTSLCQSQLYTDRNPVAFSLKPNIPYQVKIDSAWENMPEKGDIENGVSKWNNWQLYNCSNITFHGFGLQTFTNYSADAPAGTIYWQRKDPQNGHLGLLFTDLMLNTAL